MEIDYPTGAQEPQLRALWQLSFGDSEEFIAGFFASGYCPRRCRCAAENGNVAAALYWFARAPSLMMAATLAVQVLSV